jgi:hypothetical protein
LLLSVCSSRHAPLQNDCPAVGHTQVLFMHFAPPEPRQVTPQAPQLLSSFVVSTHPPLQSASGSQRLAHLPLRQTTIAPVDPEHVFPQAPQLVRFAAMSTHPPEHKVGMAPPVHAQVPFTHCSPPGHILPQAPQLFGSFCRSTHARLQLVSVPVPPPPLATLLVLPLALLPPLSLVLASSPLPVSLAPVSASMVVPVSPAPASSLPPPSLTRTRTSPPASAMPPLLLLLLLPLPMPHPLLHWPERQTRGAGHFLLQRPQLSGSDVRSAHVWSLPQKTFVGHILPESGR